VEGDTVHLYPHSGQLRALRSVARIIAVIAGSQGGKTSLAPWWAEQEIRARGSGDGIVATASYDLFQLKLLPEMREVFEHVLEIGRYWSSNKVIEIANPETGQFEANRADDPMWARIILRSAVAKGGLESSTAKWAILDEAGQDSFTLDAWDAVNRRVMLNQGRILIPTTPYNMGWIKQLIVDRADTDPDIDLIQFESIENPSFPKEEFERLRNTMPSWKFNMFMRGQYTRPPGMIYTDFKDEYRERGGHKVKPFDLPLEWPREVGVDPGVINTCKLWWAHDTECNIYYAYRESLGERKSAIEHARDALGIASQNREHVIKWAVGAKSEIYHREDWIKAGAKGVVEPEYSDVEAGIDRVIALLREGRLFFFDTLHGVLDQIVTYSRELDGMGQPTVKIKDKEKFHYLDALRYLAVSVSARKPLTVTTSRYA